ncbi:MAG: hypothetical protein ACK56F_13700 [bacterium]
MNADTRVRSLVSHTRQDSAIKSKVENHVLRMELKNLNQCLTDLIEQIKDFSRCHVDP